MIHNYENNQLTETVENVKINKDVKIDNITVFHIFEKLNR